MQAKTSALGARRGPGGVRGWDRREGGERRQVCGNKPEMNRKCFGNAGQEEEIRVLSQVHAR